MYIISSWVNPDLHTLACNWMQNNLRKVVIRLRAAFCKARGLGQLDEDEFDLQFWEQELHSKGYRDKGLPLHNFTSDDKAIRAISF